MVTLHCSVCGAPYTGNTNKYVCPHCGASIEPGLDLSAQRERARALLCSGGTGSGIWR